MNEEQKQLSEATTETLALRKEAEYLASRIKTLKVDQDLEQDKLDKIKRELNEIYKAIDKKSEEAMKQVRFEEQRVRDIQNKRNLELNARETAISDSSETTNRMKADITIAYNKQQASMLSAQQSELTLKHKIEEIDKIKKQYDKKNEDLVKREQNLDINNQAQIIVEKNLRDKELELKAKEAGLEQIEQSYLIKNQELKDREHKVNEDALKNNELLTKITNLNREYLPKKQELDKKEKELNLLDIQLKDKAKQLNIMELDLKKKERMIMNR